jgi:hypothetical protein
MKGNSLIRKLKPLLPDLRQGYQIDIAVTRDVKGEKTKSKNSAWITMNRKIPPIPPPSPPEPNSSTNSDRDSGDTPSDGGDISSTTCKIPPPKEPENDAHFEKSGDIGGSGDIFGLRHNSSGTNNTAAPLLGGKDCVAFDIEWKDDGTGNRTIYAAAFVDSRGNQKVLHISDYGNSEPELLRAITDEILKHPASMGWYTTGIARGRYNRVERGASAAE